MNLNRTEELEIKKDIKGIKKALENIASGIVPVKPTTQVVVKDGDPFFGKIHMSETHMDAWCDEFGCNEVRLVGLMEECAELQQALSKFYRNYARACNYDPKEGTYGPSKEKDQIIEEMAHVLVDIRMVCETFDITPEALQQEFYKKYPEGYDLTIMMADNKPYYYVPKEEKS